ncbi:sensor histidine kinase [Niallia sp.]|uniref:sensor histidine kinase n=1 Tax=Niallia sp. TaxID=2837523 RepID=UPI00289B3ABA|nr:sensor histidine kinase [Niallia sp.]
MEDLLAKYIGSEKYIQSVYLYDSKGREFLSGSSSNSLDERKRATIFKLAESYEGENYWMEVEGSNGYLLSVRLIRSYDNLNFESIGNLLVRVNLDKIVSDLPGEKTGDFVISKKAKIIYSGKETDYLNEYPFLAKNQQGYSIEKINGKSFFISQVTTEFADWTYWNIIPFKTMFSKITTAKYSFILVFMLMFLILISLCFKFFRRITNPIRALADIMQKVQKGNFNVVNSSSYSMEYEDEVGILYRNFKTMIEKIDELIQENYMKQLLIKETEFKAMQAQINPHFLYNTLETINWLAKTNKQKQISSMVEALGNLMRSSINFKRDIIKLEEEVEIVESFLIIQKYRFDDKVDFQMEIPSNLMQCKIPKLILQPLLENSFKHAVETSIYMSVIKLYAYQEGEKLFIRIEDNGPGIDPLIIQKVKEGKANPKGNGIGLNNIDTRIKIFAGENYGLRIENLSGKGTAITVILPFQTE